MPIYWLDQRTITFPDPEEADPQGILAVGGDLSVERLLFAYQIGIFPWFNPGDPILWWSPEPRFVLFPEELKVAKSMRPYFNQQKYSVSFDTQFREVMVQCARGISSGGTWITREMVEAYAQLHEMGYAHSVEVWEDEELVGGLYGLALGKCFFGESMFTHKSNASKFGFITLVRRLHELGYELIDCQQETSHLASLGARSVSRKAFLDFLKKNEEAPTHRGSWKELPHKEPPLEYGWAQ